MSTPREVASRPRKTARRQRAPECWACGELAPQCSYVGRFGWRTRAVQVEYYTMTEVYCPDCFARWGWPEPVGGAA